MTRSAQKFTFATIVTKDYLHLVFVLRDSLLAFSDNVDLHVLVVDLEEAENLPIPEGADCKALNFVPRSRLLQMPWAPEIYERLGHLPRGRLRWALKGVLLRLLLQSHNPVVYLDPDIYFLSSYRFLFDLLLQHHILLTPHFRPKSPYQDPDRFRDLLTDGLFNAGFLGVSRGAEEMLDWWTQCCLVACEKKREVGVFYDQRYLDLVPIYFENSHILRNIGCNLAEWNIFEYEISQRPEDGHLLVNGIPAVFLHMTSHYKRCTILRFRDAKQKCLREIVERYRQEILRYNPAFDIYDKAPVFKSDA